MSEPFMPKLTLSDTWGVVKDHIILSFVRVALFAFFWVLIWLIQYFLKGSVLSIGLTELNDFLKTIPWWIYISIALSAFFWYFGRGGRVSLPFPLIDFKLWLLLTLVTFASFAAIALLPVWIGLPLFYFLNPFFYIEELIETAQSKNVQDNE